MAVVSYAAVLYVSRSAFGLSAAGIRDNPRRMAALGFNVARIGSPPMRLRGLIAALGGMLLVWFNGRISPGTIGIGPVIDILVIAVIGGLRHPVGAVYRRADLRAASTFAIDLHRGAERFKR